MNPVRDRRLRSDRDAVHAFLAASYGRVTLDPLTADLPETYSLTFRCRSVTAINGSNAVIGESHRVRVYLPAAYPAAAPVATLRTPVIHPHIWPNGTVCLGSWNPAEKLNSVLARIGDILVFDPAGLNWRSVANEAAVPWAREHSKELPLDDVFAPGQPAHTA